MTSRLSIRPPAIEPRGLRRTDAANYLGISPSKFDDWVSRRIMPTPKRQDGVVVWDRRTLDAAFDALADGSTNTEANVWDTVSV